MFNDTCLDELLLLPEAHTRHALELFAPATKENAPAGQVTHPDNPGTSEYVPAAHTLHTDELVAPCIDEYWPVGQLRHSCTLFMSTENVPTMHVHVWILQFVFWADGYKHDAATEYVFSGQRIDAGLIHPCQNIAPPPPRGALFLLI